MKKLVLGVAAVIALSSGVASAHEVETKLDKSIENILVKVCKATANNDASKLKSLVKEHRINMRTAADKIQCNGESLAQFAIQHSAPDSASYIADSAKINLNQLMVMNK